MDLAVRSFQRQLSQEILISPLKHNCFLRRQYYGSLSKRIIDLTERLQHLADQFSNDIGHDIIDARSQCPLSAMAHSISSSDCVDLNLFTADSIRFSYNPSFGRNLHPGPLVDFPSSSKEQLIGMPEMPQLLFSYALFH